MIKRDDRGKAINFTSIRRAAPSQVIDEMEELYRAMLHCEKKDGLKGSLSYLEGFLKEKGMGYDEFLEELIKPKGILDTLLSSFKKLIN